jgi:hypothetical protein
VTSSIAVDNDVILKLTYYGLLGVEPFGHSSDHHISILATARYVVGSRLRRDNKGQDPGELVRRANSFFSMAEATDPTPEETELATNIEAVALRIGLELDTGESLLTAISLARSFDLLLTGDKRAIAAIEALLDHVPGLSPLSGRFVCLEQLALSLVEAVGIEAVRAGVCGCPQADTALAICFSCSVPSVPFDPAGLRSYIESMRLRASRVLRAGSTAFTPNIT